MNRTRPGHINPCAAYAIAAAVLFGASTPAAKFLVGGIEPILLAGLMYFGSGLGLGFFWLVLNLRKGRQVRAEAPLSRGDFWPLAGAIFSGGLVGPVLMMIGLTATAGSTASLILNLEGVFTALVAWLVFREHCNRRIILGMAAIIAGGFVLSWTGMPEGSVPWGPIAVTGACLAWAMDNNLTRKVSESSPVQIAALKGLIAGAANIALGLLIGSAMPTWSMTVLSGVAGLGGYGISLVLFILALRGLGTARTAAYFSVSPFIGAAIAIPLLSESLTWVLGAAAALMGIGVYLYLIERHGHRHVHGVVIHDHRHVHDEHHLHEHEGPTRETHAHEHSHEPIIHTHSHYPDLHHRHEHPA